MARCLLRLPARRIRPARDEAPEAWLHQSDRAQRGPRRVEDEEVRDDHGNVALASYLVRGCIERRAVAGVADAVVVDVRLCRAALGVHRSWRIEDIRAV